MEEKLCPFVNALLGGEHRCQFAQEVTRRSGPSILCEERESFDRCEAVYNSAKSAALPVLGYQDDLLSMPHSIMVKIQFGTITGLQQLEQGHCEEIADVGALVRTVSERYGGTQHLPYGSLVPSIEQYRLQRRRSRT